MKLSHINLPGLTTEILSEDMSKRMKESKGAPVLYPYETVEALLAAIHLLEVQLCLVHQTLPTVIVDLDSATTKVARKDIAETLTDLHQSVSRLLSLRGISGDDDF